MQLEAIEIETGPQPKACLIILHGLGADGSDFEPFCEELNLDDIGAVRFVMPSAPVMPVTINGGYQMRAWYDIRPSDQEGREDETSLRAAHNAIDTLLEREAKRGIPTSRTVLMGFSQGCAMALMTGLRHPHQLAGIVGLSGYLPLLGSTQAEAHAANHATPIFMAHGRYDDIVPIDRGERARDFLTEQGYEVEWHEYPMAHSLCMPEVHEINEWLLRRLR